MMESMEVRQLRAEMNARFGAMEARIGRLEIRVEEMSEELKEIKALIIRLLTENGEKIKHQQAADAKRVGRLFIRTAPPRKFLEQREISPPAKCRLDAPTSRSPFSTARQPIRRLRLPAAWGAVFPPGGPFFWTTPLASATTPLPARRLPCQRDDSPCQQHDSLASATTPLASSTTPLPAARLPCQQHDSLASSLGRRRS